MSVRSGLKALRASAAWKPSVAAYLLRSRRRARIADGAELPADAVSLRGVAEWLARAQDATNDGGIAGRYRLAGGWSSSYPETTGYAIPTLLALAKVLNDDRYRERAHRCVEFLLSVQLPSGAFPGLEIADNRTNPSPFNSAQIVHGLHVWHRDTGDRAVLDPLVRAAQWVCDVQDDDGAWRQFFYRQLACAYSAHAGCWLADAGADLEKPRFLRVAERNLRWVLTQRDPVTGWFDRCGFSEADHRARRAHTHTIAYTLDGVRRMAQRLGDDEAREAVVVAATAIMERLERSRSLPGMLDYQWKPRARYACLTGNAQMALIWLELAQATHDLRFVNAAFKAIDEIKAAQALDAHDGGICGGVPGSSPIGGDYIQFAIPNWAAKFFADALMAKQDCLDRWLDTACAMRRSEPAAAGSGTTTITVTPAPHPVAVYTTRISPTFARLADRWAARGFRPALVVIETGDASAARRFVSSLRGRSDDSRRICRSRGWTCVQVASVNSRAAVEAVTRAAPHIAVAAGAGILRDTILAVPKIGTLGCHMALLPAFRGMNVAEWAALLGQPVGCSVFWIDKGIDTGPIAATAAVDATGCMTIAALRTRVDEAQIALLDETLRTIVDRGVASTAIRQNAIDGVQYFRMHADLRRVLERRLERPSRA